MESINFHNPLLARQILNSMFTTGVESAGMMPVVIVATTLLTKEVNEMLHQHPGSIVVIDEVIVPGALNGMLTTNQCKELYAAVTEGFHCKNMTIVLAVLSGATNEAITTYSVDTDTLIEAWATIDLTFK